jgi:lysophospholipase L1-like esterase
LKDGPTGQHVPLQQYRTNLKTILSHSLIEARQPTIFLVTPPPINEAHLWEFDSKKGYSAVTRHQKVTAHYAEVVRELAKENEHKKVVLIDLWEALMKESRQRLPPTNDGKSETNDDEGLRKLLVDGLHLTGAGYKIFLDMLLPLVGPEWTTEDPDNPLWVFP